MYLFVDIRFRHRPQQFVEVTSIFSPFRGLCCLSRNWGNKAAFNIRYICNVGVLYLPVYLQILRTQRMLLYFLELYLPKIALNIALIALSTPQKIINCRFHKKFYILWRRRIVINTGVLVQVFNLTYNISFENLKCW
jgi:hypothetical protein